MKQQQAVKRTYKKKKEFKKYQPPTTESPAVKRQIIVEKYMLAGYSLTQILAVRNKKGQTLGTINTIKGDMNLIRSRWLDLDPQWFHRTRLARILAVNRLTEQLVRISQLIAEIRAGEYNNKIKSNEDGGAFVSESNGELPKKLVYAESQLTNIIKAIYEIDSDFDPEQFIDSRIRESIVDKIKVAETKNS